MQTNSKMGNPSIFFVSTPIGNLGDITIRAIETLQKVNLIACEDTRHSAKLLQRYKIEKKPLISFNEQNEKRRIPEILKRIKAGEKIAVMSDAGTPCICDPGYLLIQECIKEKIEFTVLPGANAGITALVLSSAPPYPFFFGGFLPSKKNKRRQIIQQVLSYTHTSLFYESPHRIFSTLEIITEENPSVFLCICREISKKFETCYRGTAKEIKEQFENIDKIKGEIVLILAPHKKCPSL